MLNYYDVDIIPIILRQFKVNNIVIGGLLDQEVFELILEYCKDEDSSYVEICKDNEDNILEVLPNFNNYDAIFLDNDSNWYTVYNELDIILSNNNVFPLVFICNNIFPHKRRDSYHNPNIIPNEFRNDYSNSLMFNDFEIKDGLFHAINENTPKNGVLTAIEDFLKENSSISIMDIRLINGITILYSDNSINYIRLGVLSKKIEDYDFQEIQLLDNIHEKKFLIDYISKFNSLNENLDEFKEIKSELTEKNVIIKDYEDKIKLHDVEINYKNSQIEGIDSKLNNKNAQIKSFESKLLNREMEINDLKNRLENANATINSLRMEFGQKIRNFQNNEIEFNNKISLANSEINILKTNLYEKENIFLERESELKNRLDDTVNQLNNQNYDVQFKNNLIKIKDKELKDKELAFNSLKSQYHHQLYEADNKEYCISCYKEEINNNHLEIEYLKGDTVTRKILSPLSYVYLIFKSKPQEISLNLKLYKALKNSNCFDIGFYLNNNADLRKSKWCKYFSPELHYVCNGFGEKRKFNKKYFNRNSKKELLEYIINCH